MKSDAGEIKICPWCGEQIKKTAVICRFCYNDVTPRGEQAALRFKSAEAPPAVEGVVPGRVMAPGDPILARLSKLVPKRLLEGIVGSAETIEEGERRPIAILFSDICGFTLLTEEIGIEAMSDLLDVIHAATQDVVEHYGGILEKLIGDAVMVVFGAPVAHGDDPERAIRAAVDIRETVRKIGASQDLALDTHGGIAFGEVVFKSVGGEGRLDFRTIGDAVNLASRLQGLAGSGEILVDHRIYQQTRTTFEWEHFDPVMVKGKKEPVVRHLVRGIRKEFSKVVLGERIEMVPLVGRRAELELLKGATKRTAEGNAQVAMVLGDAGVGKSRLVYELYHQLPEGKYHWFTGRSLSFGTSVPFLPIIALMRSIVRFPFGSEATIEFKGLRQAVTGIYGRALRRTRSISKRKEVTRRRDLVLNALAVLLSINHHKNPLLDLAPRERRERIFAAVVDLITQLCAEKPTILIFEDFHWADKDSLELLDSLIVKLQAKPVMMVIVTRPELPHRFPMEEEFLRISLEELSEKESKLLLSRLLHLEHLPSALREKILAKTEGNPFYIEEVVLNLEDRGILKRRRERYQLVRPLEAVDIPDTVEGVVLARLDRLEHTVKRVLQCASVIGREFQYSTLAHVMEIGKRLRAYLLSLVEKDFVLQGTLLPELIYIFRHVVLRDAAYGTLLEKRRRFFHARVAEALEEIFAERVEEFLELIAFHYEHGGVTEKALHFLERAAIKCEGLYANIAAADHWERLLALLEKVDLADADVKRLCLRANLRLGEICRRMGHPERGVSAFQSARSIAQALKDSVGVIRALLGLSEAFRHLGETEKGLKALREALRRARSARDEKLVASCQNYIGHFERTQGNFTKARAAFEEVLRFAIKTGDRQRRYQALNHLGAIRMYSGQTEEANKCYSEALELARELGRENEQVQIELNIGINHLRLGECSAAEERIAAALGHAEKIEFERGMQLSLLALVDLHLKTGDFRRAATLSRRLFKRMEESSFSDVRACALSNQARAFVALGKLDQAEKNIEEALKSASADKNYFGLMDGLAVKTELLLGRSSNKEALETAQEMLSLVKQHRDKEFLAPAQTLCARSLLALNKVPEAKKLALDAVKSSRRARIPRDEGWALWVLSLCEKDLGQETRTRNYLKASLKLAEQTQDATLISTVRQTLGAM